MFGVKGCKVQMTGVHQRQQERVILPVIDVTCRIIGHDVDQWYFFQRRARENVEKFLQKVIGEAPRPGPKLNHIHWLAEVEWGRSDLAVSQEAENDFRIGIRDKGVAGDVMRDSTSPPGINPSLLEIVALEFPKN